MTTRSELPASSAVARVAALLVAVLLAAGAYFLWQRTAALNETAQAGLESSQLQALGTSDAVAACKERRFAEIEAELTAGVLDEEGAGRARLRAVNLCIMQNRPAFR